MIALAERLDRTLIIRARPEVVFRFLTDSPAVGRLVGRRLDDRCSPWRGRCAFDTPTAPRSRGKSCRSTHLSASPSRMATTAARPFLLGGSRVTIRLDPHPEGTLLQLTHEFADPEGA